MNAISQALKWASAGAFVFLGIVTLLDWARHRDRKRAYIAAAVGLLGIVSVVGGVQAIDSVHSGLLAAPVALRFLNAFDLILLVLSGYALLLLRDALVPYARPVKRALQIAALAAAATSAAVPLPSDPSIKPGAAQAAFLFYVIGFWTFCIGEPALRLWLRARHLPAVQRARMRAFSSGYGLIVVIIVVAIGAGSAARSPGFQLSTQVLGFLTVPILYVSFAPPVWLRRLWRGTEEAAFARGVRDLLASTSDPAALANGAIEWACRLVGADGSALVDLDGRVLAARGIDADLVRRVVSSQAEARVDDEVVVVPLTFDTGRGWLIVRAGPITPLFGADEVVQLEVYATHLSIALDRCRLIAALRESEVHAREANEAKSRFLASMSHELRTPMGAILGFSDVLADGIDGELNAEQKDDVERIRVAGRHLLVLLDDVLDIAKIEAGKLELSTVDLELGALIADVLATLHPVAAQKALTLAAAGLDGVRVRADEQRLRQVMLNLLTNAIKFTETGSVTVNSEPEGDLVRITVQDTGVGIPREAQELIFDEFHQVDGSERRSKGGTGLGLAICRSLVEMHGGTIGCESTLGRGSTFWFTLPRGESIAPSSARQTQPVPVAVSIDPSRAARPSPWDGSTGDVVLVIDDDADARSLISKRLREGGYMAVEASTGAEGVEVARMILPLAITLDLRTPVSGRAEVLQSLSADPRTRDIPVVLITVTERTHVAVSLDRVSYVQKPFVKEDLLTAIAAVVRPLLSYDVMVVDDDPNVPQLISKALGALSATVRYAASGPEALEAAITKPPDMIFLDLLMPEMSGFEVISRLRANDRTRHVPIIVASAKELTAADIRLLDDQIARFLHKRDLTSGDLASTVRQIVRGRHPVRA